MAKKNDDFYETQRNTVGRLKTNFGQLLENYYRNRGMKQQDLKKCLDDRGFPSSLGQISHYEYGDRSPTSVFIFHVALCLGLREDETSALMEAYILDFRLKFLEEYVEVAENKSSG